MPQGEVREYGLSSLFVVESLSLLHPSPLVHAVLVYTYKYNRQLQLMRRSDGR